LAPRSSAAFIIATVSASLREPLRRWKSVHLELGWSYCAPQESGTGKELAARALHEAGPRAKGPFVPVNMANLEAGQARAELFGHRKGAFTGATADVPGHFRSAAGGTIFLDEIGYLTSEVQPMLLRVLDDHEILPLGTSKPEKVDVRVVAATDRTWKSGSKKSDSSSRCTTGSKVPFL
jgi:transcriptional regulator with AAA-type ATPase domain